MNNGCILGRTNTQGGVLGLARLEPHPSSFKKGGEGKEF